MRALKALATCGVMVLASCDTFDAPDQNASTISDLTSSAPTRTAVATAAQGLLGSVQATNGGIRNFFGFQAQTLGILGREGYNLDVSNPQNIPTFYGRNAGNAFKNLTLWTAPYATLKQANILLKAANNVGGGTTAAEKAGLTGYVQTIKAYTLFIIIRATDVSGAALDATDSATADPPPIMSKAQVYTQILSLLDAGATSLAAGGSSFMFSIPPGFSNFGTPAAFLQFNKALRAKVNVTNGAYAAALTDLGASFMDTTQAPTMGAYVTYSTAGTDATNGLYDPTSRQRYVHPAMAFDAQCQAGTANCQLPGGDTTKRDLRFLNKVVPIGTLVRFFFTVNWGLSVYKSNGASWAVITNEELALLNAEALLACSSAGQGVAVTCTGSAAQRLNALTLVNWVRSKSGGLALLVGPPAAGTPARNGVARTTGDNLLDEILYNKRYSLFYQNGDRWVDSRRYGILAGLKTDERNPAQTGVAADVIWANTMIPINECLPRTTQPAGCTTVPAFY